MKIIAISGAHGCGKTSVLEELQKQNHQEIFIDDFKVSRTVLAELGLTLEQATKTATLTQKYQKLVLSKKIDRDGVVLPSAVYDPQVRSVFVDRSIADVYAYTRLWVEKNNVDKKWFADFEDMCISTIRMYSKVLLIPIGKFPFVDDGVRAKEETQQIIATYIEEFVKLHCDDYVIIEPTSIVDRANLFATIAKEQ